ncbi:MAG TPA: acyltransferase, partial [Ferruginibacter sp.]|nr:acyltransferase [Ferruginibacter sp.]
ILLVILIHTQQYGLNNPTGTLANIINAGKNGVQLFYVASAFTLMLSFSNRKNKEKYPNRNFFLRRFFRIAPMYYIGILYYLWQDGLGPRYWLGDAAGVSAGNILSNFLFLHGFNPYWITSVVPGGWSIAVEMTFYAVFPWLASRIRNLNQAILLFVVSLLIRLLLERLLMPHPMSSPDLWYAYLFFYFPSQLPVFALGIVLYFIVTQKEQSIQPAYLLILAALWLYYQATGSGSIFPSHIQFGLGFLLLAFALSRYQPVWLVNPVTIYIGKLSFSMYLLHFAVLHWLQHFHCTDFVSNPSVNYLIRYGLVVLGTVGLSTLAYRLVELPMQEVGKRLIGRWER